MVTFRPLLRPVITRSYQEGEAIAITDWLLFHCLRINSLKYVGLINGRSGERESRFQLYRCSVGKIGSSVRSCRLINLITD